MTISDCSGFFNFDIIARTSFEICLPDELLFAYDQYPFHILMFSTLPGPILSPPFPTSYFRCTGLLFFLE